MAASIRTIAELVLAVSIPAVAASAQMPDPLPPANAAPLVYCPPERLAAGPASVYHVLNVFLPPGAPPRQGWPVVIATGYGGGASVPAAPTLSASGASQPLYDLVDAGIAVVHFGTPGLSGNRGLWYPPGHPSGRYESFLPRDDNAEKSAEWVVQWTKVQTLYPFDLERIGLRGSSGGAALAIRTAMGPERARATGSAQLRASTRVAAVLAIQPPTSVWALEQGPELTIAFPGHLEQRDQPGVPAETLEQVDEQLQKAYSLMRESFASAEARENNGHQPLCLVYGDPVLRIDGAVATFELDATGFPLLHDAICQPLQHDSWFGYAFWKRLIELSPDSAAFHAQHSLFAMRDVNALPPPLDLQDVTFAGTVHGPAAERIGHDWLVDHLVRRPRLRAAASPAVDEERWTLALVGEGPRAGEPLRLVVAGPGCPGVQAFLALGPARTGWPTARWNSGGTRGVFELAVPDDASLAGWAVEARAFVLAPTSAGRSRWRHSAALALRFDD